MIYVCMHVCMYVCMYVCMLETQMHGMHTHIPRACMCVYAWMHGCNTCEANQEKLATKRKTHVRNEDKKLHRKQDYMETETVLFLFFLN